MENVKKHDLYGIFKKMQNLKKNFKIFEANNWKVAKNMTYMGCTFLGTLKMGHRPLNFAMSQNLSDPDNGTASKDAKRCGINLPIAN